MEDHLTKYTNPSPNFHTPSPSPHVVIFPLPIQAPVNCMLKLADLILSLSPAAVSVTFLTTDYIHHRLVLNSNAAARLVHYKPHFRFETVPDGLGPDEIPRNVPLLTISLEAQAQTEEVAKELNVPLVYFDTISPCCLWTLLCIPNMLKAADLPFQVLKKVQNFPKAQGHIIDTFDKLEGDYFTHVRALCPNVYDIGPLHLNLKCRIQQETTKSISNSLWQEDRSCLAWLDAQPSKSVLFVSIGSIASLTKQQLMEIWYGLVNSKTRFLWVQRPGSIIELNGKIEMNQNLEIPEDVVEGTKARGCIVSWAPQEEVLAHGAIGGFLTHSGWNSTLESIATGVPMICWPFRIDQPANSRVVTELWKIGLDMNKDNCNRVVVEKLIKNLMETRRDELSKRAREMAKLAAQAVAKDGTSYHSLNRLIDDIVFMRFPLLNNSLQTE
uniref:Glycosyltransferase n=1 Tax=Chenopodium quinoa TaxID=63459 RepID=A0A803L8H1_CHEQI